MTDKAAREMTFEEEAKLYKEETAEFLKSETVDSEPPFVNSILRRGNRIIRKASDRIEHLQSENKRLKAENDDLFYKLVGVMHSVDKWLDGEELKQDEVNRAQAMREKTLQIVERLQAERDKAVEDMAFNAGDGGCWKTCATHYCSTCNNVDKFLWRGLEESECEK